jgi:hypothetical protein
MKMVSSETPNATIEYSAKFSIFTSMGQGSRSLLVSQIYLFNCYQLIVLLSSLETSVTKYAPPPHKISIFSQAYFLLRGPPTRLSLFAGGVVHAYVGQKVLKRYIILIFSNFTVSQN